MLMQEQKVKRLQSKGALREDALYIERGADQQLRKALLAGEFCYVLAPRQIGKSSLRVNAAHWLKSHHDVRCIHLDLNTMGRSDGTSGQENGANQSVQAAWYFGLIEEIASQLELEDPEAFYEEHARFLPVRRFIMYLYDEVLQKECNHIVIFIDEIDYLRTLPIDTDEFFAAIRAVYNARVEKPAFERLTFCLLGVAAPADLIRNPSITPFNIGQAIDLRDFTRKELDALLPSLAIWGSDAQTWIDEIYEWTSGHPYMTLSICQRLLAEQDGSASGSIKEKIKHCIEVQFLWHGRTKETNLSFAEERLDSGDLSSQKGALLLLYRRILKGEMVFFEKSDPLHLELMLCGLVTWQRVGQELHLQIRNKIYAMVFDEKWLREKDAYSTLFISLRKYLDSNRSNDMLLRGRDLEEANAWLKLHAHQVAPEEYEFVRASLDNEQKDRERAKNALIQRRANAVLLASMVMLLALMAVVYRLYRSAKIYAENEKRHADSERKLRHDAEEALQMAKDEQATAAEALANARASADKADAATKEAKDQKNRAAVAAEQTRNSMQAVMLASQPNRHIEAILAGMQAVQAENRSVLSPLWEGITRITEEITISQVLEGHSGKVWSAAFSPDGKYVATVSDDKKIRIWDSYSGQLVKSPLEVHAAWVRSVDFSPDGQYLAAASGDQTVSIWNTATWQNVLTLRGHLSSVWSVGFSPDSQRIVTASEDKTIKIWDVQTGHTLSTLQGHTNRVNFAMFSPDGKRIASASDDRTVRIWDASNGQQVLRIEEHWNWVRAAVFSPDGQRIVTASDDRTVRILDSTTGRPIVRFQSHPEWVRFAVFSPDGKHVLTACDDGIARLWDTQTGRLSLSFQGHSSWVLSARFSSDGQRILTASADKSARIWDLRSGRLLHSLVGHSASVWSANYSPDGQQIVTASDDQSARVWDIHSSSVRLKLQDHSNWVRCAEFSSTGHRVLTASADGTARIWDALNGMLLLTLSLEGHNYWVRCASYSPDGHQVVTASTDKTARIWDAESGSPGMVLQGHNARLWSAVFSPDGRRLVTSSEDEKAIVWDVQTGKQSRILVGHTQRVRLAKFSPDGTQVITASDDRTARVWDVRPGHSQQPRVLQEHTARVWSASFSPDGQQIITASDDGTACLWDSVTGKLILKLRGHSLSILYATFSPNGKFIVTAGDDGLVLIHPIRPEMIYAFACKFLHSLRSPPGVSVKDVNDMLKTCPPA